MNRPWMPLYVADYLADTLHLTTIQHGAYDLLIMHYWRHGSIPDDDAKLAAIAKMTGAEWRRHRPTLVGFFQDGWRHKRIEAEIEKANVKHERRQNAGKRGGIASANAKQKPSNATSNAQASSSQSESERKEDTADAVPPPTRYVFEAGVIRLSAKDFDRWKASFSYLDLAAELCGLAEWAGEQEKDRWFHAVSGALAKRNRVAKIAADQVKSKIKPGQIEGILY